MRRFLIRLCTAAIFVGTLTLTLTYADPEIDEGIYDYVSAEDLDYFIRMQERIDGDRSKEDKLCHRKFIDERVMLCDQLAVFWDEIDDNSTVKDKEDREDHGYIDGQLNQDFLYLDDERSQEYLRRARNQKKYYKFETYYLRCVVPRELGEAVGYLRRTNRVKNERKLVMLWGKVEKLPLWYPVDNTYGAVEAGTRSEQILLVCDKIDRPRPRYFEQWKRDKEE